jgi:hypothetical protein
VLFQELHGAVDAAIGDDVRDGAELAAKLSDTKMVGSQ